MALTWGGHYITEELCKYIFQVTGAWPSMTSISLGSGSFSWANPQVFSTELNITSGPYILAAVRADPDYNTQAIEVKVTIDGSLLIDEGGYSPTGDNYVVGQYFDDQGNKDFMPLLARTSIKIEAAVSVTGSGTQKVQWLYAGYTLA